MLIPLADQGAYGHFQRNVVVSGISAPVECEMDCRLVELGECAVLPLDNTDEAENENNLG